MAVSILLAIGIITGLLEYGWSARFGIVLAVPLPFLITTLFLEDKLFASRQLCLLMCFLFTVAIIFTSGVRTSLIMVFVTCCLLPFFVAIVQRRWKFMCIPALFIIAAYFGLEGYSSVVGESVVNGKIQDMVSGERIASGRFDLWGYIIINLNLTTFFGHGIETFEMQ